MSKVDIMLDYADPQIRAIHVQNYQQFSTQLFDEAKKYGFSKVEVFDHSDTNVSIAYKYEKDVIYVMQSIYMKEFDNTIIENTAELFWKEFIKKRKKSNIEYHTVASIQCVCTQKMNYQFKKYITQNVQQQYKRYQIKVAVSLGGKKAYLCQTKGGFSGNVLRSLNLLFEMITKEIMI